MVKIMDDFKPQSKDYSNMQYPIDVLTEYMEKYYLLDDYTFQMAIKLLSKYRDKKGKQ
jgi:hypothetical protein